MCRSWSWVRTSFRSTDFDEAALRVAGQREHRVAVVGHEGIQVHEVADVCRDVLQRAGNDEAATGEAEKDDVVEAFVVEGGS
jgi:hypothetical protein